MNKSYTETKYCGSLLINTPEKIGFMCSRKMSASSILVSYDWAIEQVKLKNCVIGGFHSRIERDVLGFLLKGDQPLIIVLARGMYRHWQPDIKARLDRGNLLIISPFDDSVTKVTPQTCLIRNRLIIELADSIVIGYASSGGQIDKLLKETSKPVLYLDQ